MKFKGTIIITDPCYVIKDTEERLREAGITVKFPHFNDDEKAYAEAVRKWRELVHPYDDWRNCNCGDNMEKLGFTTFISKPTIYGDWSCTTYSTPCTDVKNQVEKINELCNKLYETEEGSKEYQFYDEEIIKETSTLKDIGHFCADAGMVAVFLLDEVLKYNPDFEKWIGKHSWCVTTIPDFDGDIQYYVDNDNNAHIIGKGNINFFTSQTGL